MLDRVAAVVNDGVVLNSELDEQVSTIGERLRQQKLELPPQNVLRQQVLERLILQEIQAQRANRAGLKVPDEALNSALTEVAQRNNIPLSQLPEALQQQGIDYANYREEMRKELTLGLLRQRDVLQRISITPREVDQFLAKQASTPSENNQYNVSHILVAVDETPRPSSSIRRRSARSRKWSQRARGGEDFAKLAVAYSNAQTALEQGGAVVGGAKAMEVPTVPDRRSGHRS